MGYTTSDERGQAAALVIGLLGILAVVIIAIAMLGQALADVARAQTAADAAALVGAVQGRQAAADMASMNGAQLTSFTSFGSDVVVRVRVRRASATARAAIERAVLPTLVINGADRHSG